VEQNSRKDSSSVLGILQQAQSNLARGRAGAVRGATKAGPSDGTKTAQLEALQVRLQSGSIPADGSERISLEREIVAMVKSADPQHVVELVEQVQKLEALKGERLLDEMCQATVPTIPRCGGALLARLTSAYASWIRPLDNPAPIEDKSTLPEGARAFFTGAAAEVSKNLTEITPSDLSIVAGALAHMGFGTAKLFTAIAKGTIDRSDSCKPSELVSLVSAFDKARLHHTGFLEVITQKLKASVKDVAAKDVQKGMRYLACASYRDEKLGQAVMDVLAKKSLPSGLTAEEYCGLAWSLCVLDFYNERLIRGVFRALEDVERLSSDTLCELYELHLASKAQHSSYSSIELDSDTVQSLKEHYSKHHARSARFLKMERPSERCHAEVADALQKVVDGIVQPRFESPSGLIADIGVTKKKSTSSSVIVLVEIEGPHVVHRSLDAPDSSHAGGGSKGRLRGPVAMKRKILQKGGYKVAVISEDDWRGHDDARAKREYLKSVILQAGVSKEKLL